MDLQLQGKTAIITGGSGGGGIGRGWIVPYEANDVGEGSLWNRFGFDTMGKPEDMEKALQEGTLYNMSGQLISVSGGAYMP